MEKTEFKYDHLEFHKKFIKEDFLICQKNFFCKSSVYSLPHAKEKSECFTWTFKRYFLTFVTFILIVYFYGNGIPQMFMERITSFQPSKYSVDDISMQEVRGRRAPLFCPTRLVVTFDARMSPPWISEIECTRGEPLKAPYAMEESQYRKEYLGFQNSTGIHYWQLKREEITVGCVC